MSWDNSYDFEEVTSYDIYFKKGWNLVKHTLIEKEDWKNETDQGGLPKTISITSIVEFPSDVKWYVKLFGQ